MNMVTSLILLACTGLAACSALPRTTCPVVYQRSRCSPEESSSTCWSPGQPDVDCPGNGICCFDGCSNQCGLPISDAPVEVPLSLDLPAPTTTAPAPAPAPECTTVLVDKNETVIHEMCAEAPGPDVCHSVWEDECKEECRDVETPEEVCNSEWDEVCTDKPCYPITELVNQTETECVTSPEECHTVPEEECKNVTQEVCDNPANQTNKVCQVVRMSGGECGSKMMCKQELGVQCKASQRRWRRHATSHTHDKSWLTSKFGDLKWRIEEGVSSKKGQLSSKNQEIKDQVSSKTHQIKGKLSSKAHQIKGKLSSKASQIKGKLSSKADQLKEKLSSKADQLKGKICWPAKVEKCRWVAKECEKEVCQDETVAPTCREVTTPNCQLVEREECVPARQTCADVIKQVPVQSTQHCPVPPQQSCRQVENKVCKTVQTKSSECNSVCTPLEKVDCQPGKPVQNCREVPKTVTYKVPKKVCTSKW